MTEEHQIMTLEEVLHLAGETITKNNNLKNNGPASWEFWIDGGSKNNI